MIKKIFGFILSCLLASPLIIASTEFAGARKPVIHEIFSKKTYAIASLVTIADILYLLKTPQDQKMRDAQGKIFHKNPVPPSAFAQSIATGSFAASSTILYLGSVIFLTEKGELFSWNRRNNQEVFDDAVITYNTIVKKMTPTNYLAKDPIKVHTEMSDFLIQNPSEAKKTLGQLSILYQKASYKKYILSEKHALLADHYDALKERLERDATLANINQWNELAEKMDTELKKLQSFITHFSETTENLPELLKK